MPEVPGTRTPATVGELRDALAMAMLGASARERGYTLAWMLIETDSGRALIRNNPGNLIVPEAQTPTRTYWRPPWYVVGPDSSERNKRLHAEMLEGRAPSAFAAYPTLADGVAAYVHLRDRDRFAPLRSAVTPEQYVRAIESTGYTVGFDVPATIKTFTALVKQHAPEALRSAPAGVGGSLVGMGLATAVALLSLAAIKRKL